MKKRVVLYAVLGLVFYLLFLIIQMPASWFAWGLNQYSHGAIRLDPLDGSLWNGNGRLVIYYPQTAPHELSSVEWRINPFWLFAGRLQMNWQTNSRDFRINTTIRMGAGQVELLDTEAAFPAQSLGNFYPAVTLISPQGQVRLHIDKLAVDQNGMTGDGDIVWQGAGSSLTTVQPLGDYHLEINSTGKNANLKLTTVSGDLNLTGQGQWQLQTGQIQLTGIAMPNERAAELEPLLKLFGQDQGNGKRALALNGRLPADLPLR